VSIIYPEATTVQGNTKIQVVTSISSLSAPSLASEINDSGSLDISCFVRDWNPELQSNQGNAPARLCTTVQLPVEGNTQFSPIEIRYVYDPQAATSTNDNKARALLTRGTEFYFVVRKGLDAQNTDWATTQYAEVWKVRCGRQNYVRSGEDEFSEYEISQLVFPLTEPTFAQIAA
jgi:hypothetical protein